MDYQPLNVIIKEINELVAAQPLVDPKEERSVQFIFIDGEHASTKAGDIYMQRTVHLFAPKIIHDPKAVECITNNIDWPNKACGFDCVIFVDPNMRSSFPKDLRTLILRFNAIFAQYTADVLSA